MTQDARAYIRQRAAEYGLQTLRFAQIGPTPRFDAFERWMAAGQHADLDWLREGLEDRADPRARLARVRTAVVFAVEYHHRVPPDPGGRTGRVARYAWGRDYHNLVGKRLKKLRSALRRDGIATWGGVDSAPIVERAWAQAAGLGFSGKNCMQILPGRTSYFFLGLMFADIEVEPDPPITKDHCGSCVRCLRGCPTDAFAGPHVLDARRCISYWTIEARALAPESLLPNFGRWFFGCDVCQEVCPHNHAPPDPEEDDLLPRNAWIELDEVLAASDEELDLRFNGTPLRRPGAAGLKRNALIVLGNLGDPGAEASIGRGFDHGSDMVRAAADYARRCLEGRVIEGRPVGKEVGKEVT